MFKLSCAESKSKNGKRAGSCTGKPAKFGNASQYAIAFTPSARKNFGKRKKNKKEANLATATVSTKLIVPPMPKIEGVDLSEFLATIPLAPRRSGAMEEFDMATLNFNTASIIANDATESSEGSDTSDSEDYMTKYGIEEKMDTDEENRRKEATWKWFQENRTSSEEENNEENNEVEYISTDTAESRMREIRQQMSPEDFPGAQQKRYKETSCR